MGFPLNSNEAYIKDTGERSTLGKEISGSTYTLPTASADVKGGVKIGGGLTMTGDVLSVSSGGGGKVYNHQLVFQHGTNAARKLCVSVCTSSNTPITKDDAFDVIYNDGAAITLYGVSIGTSATLGISANMDGTTKRFAYIDSNGSNNNPVSSTVFTDTVFEM